MKKVALPLISLMTVVSVFLWFRIHKNNQQEDLARQLQKPLLYEIGSGQLEVATYEGAHTPLWLDRSYTTETTVEALHGLSFVRAKRDSRDQLVLDVSSATTVYALGNSKVENNYSDWELTDIPVSVVDSYLPRSMNAVYSKSLQPGRYILNYWEMVPAAPVFFDAKAVQLAQ